MAVKFEINIPMKLALTRTDPRFNELYKTWMYSVVDEEGREEKMFLPDDETLRGIPVMQVFSICKRKTGQGAAYFDVRRNSPPPAVEQPSRLESQLQASIDQANNAQRTPTLSKATPAAQPKPTLISDNRSQSEPFNATPALGSSMMAGALVAAIDAVAIAQQYAMKANLGITFSAEHVEKIAVCLYIQHSKEDPRFAQRAAR